MEVYLSLEYTFWRYIHCDFICNMICFDIYLFQIQVYFCTMDTTLPRDRNYFPLHFVKHFTQCIMFQIRPVGSYKVYILCYAFFVSCGEPLLEKSVMFELSSMQSYTRPLTTVNVEPQNKIQLNLIRSCRDETDRWTDIALPFSFHMICTKDVYKHKRLHTQTSSSHSF